MANKGTVPNEMSFISSLADQGVEEKEKTPEKLVAQTEKRDRLQKEEIDESTMLRENLLNNHTGKPKQTIMSNLPVKGIAS